MRSPLAALLSAALVFGIGCGGVTTVAAKKPVRTKLYITWSNDGNPGVPVCGTQLVNCKKNLVVIDTITGTRTTLSITATSYTAPVTTDTYAVHVIGFDLNGKSIESACCNVVVK